MSDTIFWKYPEELLDEDGYPTEEALDYIRNWQVGGEYWCKSMYKELIEYIKSIWWMASDAVEFEGGLLELHTYGWSGNESIIDELNKTDLWLMKFRAKQAGGHYYFKIDSEAEEDWWVVRSKDKS